MIYDINDLTKVRRQTTDLTTYDINDQRVSGWSSTFGVVIALPPLPAVDGPRIRVAADDDLRRADGACCANSQDERADQAADWVSWLPRPDPHSLPTRLQWLLLATHGFAVQLPEAADWRSG